jgi:hypothetical protein
MAQQRDVVEAVYDQAASHEALPPAWTGPYPL